MVFSLLKNWYNNLSIRTKINSTYVLISIVLILLISFTAITISTDFLVRQSQEMNTQGLEIISKSINRLMSEAVCLSEVIATNYNMQELYKIPKHDTYNLITYQKNVLVTLDSIVGNRSIINSIIIYTDFGMFYSSHVDYRKVNVTGEQVKQWMDALQTGDDVLIWIKTHPVEYLVQGGDMNSISLIRLLIDGKTGKTYGIIQVDIDQNNISDLFPSYKYNAELDVFIADADGTILASKDRLYDNIAGEPYFQWITSNPGKGKVFTLGGRQYLVSSVRNETMGWLIVGMMPMAIYTRDVIRFTYITILVGLVCITLYIVVSSVYSSMITKPIKQLTSKMAQFGEGNLNVQSKILNNDEIGILSRNFNLMTGRISELLERIYVEQTKKREFELLALQSQINPHFLYNTLESICSLALMNKGRDAYEMTKALSLFYRSVLSGGKNIVTIREEMESAERYLQLEKIRYADQFTWKADIQQDILHCPIVKLSIQPLLENAVYHGIRNMHGKGYIRILGRGERDVIRLSVIDNGIGFPEQEFLGIVNGAGEKKSKGYGLKNVNERLRLHFGPGFGLEWKEAEVGTRIDIVLPGPGGNTGFDGGADA